jgi:uncharacterized membrane protein
MKQNFEIRKAARETLASSWGNAIVAVLIYMGITSVVASIPGLGQIAMIAIMGPLMYGFLLFFVKLVQKKVTDFNFIFKAFNFSGPNLGLFGRSLGLYWLMNLYVFLWSLLLIIPGIIAAYGYSMAFFLLIDNPEIGISEALRNSKEMMYGYKGKLFMLNLSFIGWMFLCILSFGIGFLWLQPYMMTSMVLFYEDLKKERGINTETDQKNDKKPDETEPIKIGGVVAE